MIIQQLKKNKHNAKTDTQSLYSINRNRELIFLETLQELEQRKKINGIYDLVRVAAILRLLFIDGNGLLNSLNQRFKTKIEFKLKRNHYDSFSFSSFENSDSFCTVYNYTLEKDGQIISLQKFLELKVTTINDPNLKKYLDKNNVKDSYKIREIIKLISNAHGGVHIEEWKSIPVSLQADDNSPFNINCNSSLYHILRNITDIILISIIPLKEKIIQSVKNSQPISYIISQ